jgi:tRNA(Ile)-lysidine synthase
MENPVHEKISIIENLDKELFLSAGICMEIQDASPNFLFDKNAHTAYFDLDKISFPLQIRTWRDGDFFYPFGGKGKKKLSNLFSELKLNSMEKQTTKLLCNRNGDILWIMGIRSDNRHKVTAATRKILVLSLDVH